jgi:hypothetical protein
VVAHLYRDFERVGQAVASPTEDRPDRDRVTYWHYDRAENQARTQALADQHVARFGDGPALVDALDGMIAAAVSDAAAAPADLVVRLTWGPVMAFDEFLATRWLELVVHSLDVTDGLARPPVATDAGLALVAGILDRLAARPLSADLGLTPADYIRAATGRAAAPDPDPGFPLLA